MCDIATPPEQETSQQQLLVIHLDFNRDAGKPRETRRRAVTWTPEGARFRKDGEGEVDEWETHEARCIRLLRKKGGDEG